MNKIELLANLRTIVESETIRNGVVYGSVYLPNSDFQGLPGFPQALAALTKDGDYIRVDGEFFGAVRLA